MRGSSATMSGAGMAVHSRRAVVADPRIAARSFERLAANLIA
jgi:hypothetical protein